MLTVEGIGRWLAEHAMQELVDIAAARIADTLAFDLPSNFQFMRRDETIDAARAVFIQAIEQKRPRLFAVIVTHNGKPTEKPLGLITPWDLINDQEA